MSPKNVSSPSGNDYHGFQLRKERKAQAPLIKEGDIFTVPGVYLVNPEPSVPAVATVVVQETRDRDDSLEMRVEPASAQDAAIIKSWDER